VGAAQPEHDLGGERLAHSGAAAVVVECWAMSASVCWSRSRSSWAIVAGRVWRACQELSGIGVMRLVFWPPRRRTWSWIWSVLWRVTSWISSRAMRLRSRCGVAGSDHSLGKSAAS